MISTKITRLLILLPCIFKAIESSHSNCANVEPEEICADDPDNPGKTIVFPNYCELGIFSFETFKSRGKQLVIKSCKKDHFCPYVNNKYQPICHKDEKKTYFNICDFITIKSNEIGDWSNPPTIYPGVCAGPVTAECQDSDNPTTSTFLKPGYGRITLKFKNDCYYKLAYGSGICSASDYKDDECKNYYSFHCTNVTNKAYNFEPDEFSSTKLKIKEKVSEILAQTSAEIGSSTTSIEAGIFQKCVKMTNFYNDKFTQKKSNEHSSIPDLLSEKFVDFFKLDEKVNWQDAENVLVKAYGFQNTFFNIKVVQDPIKGNVSTILIEPPSPESIRFLKDNLNKILRQDPFSYYPISKSKTLEFFQNFDGESKNSSLKFFESWLDAIERSKQPYDYSPNPNLYQTVEEWQKTYEEYRQAAFFINETTEIRWVSALKNFEKENHNISYEHIIVAHKLYFKELTDVLSTTPNKIIIKSILLKHLTENLEYINPILARELNSGSRSNLCLGETNLYAISHNLLSDYKKDEKARVLKSIIARIIKTTRSYIETVFKEDQANKSYFLFELEKITAHLFTNKWSDGAIFNYYESFDVNENYFDTITNYRRMLRNKEVLKLNKKFTMEYEPFSIIDLKKASNRFTLYVLLLNDIFEKLIDTEKFDNEYYYGVYGSKVASYLYSLLHENKYDTYVDKFENELVSHPDYARSLIVDYISENNEDFRAHFGADTISETHGLEIAYRSLFEIWNEKNEVETGNVMKFFRSYAKSHCHKEGRVVNTAVSNIGNYTISSKDGDFLYRYGCPSTGAYQDYHGTYNVFEVINDRIYLHDISSY